MVLGRQLVLFAAALALGRAATITVPYDDPSIEYSGSGWGPDIFEIRPGIDPDTGGGALDRTCKLGDNSTTTPAFGNNFSFSFKGASVSLVLETRADHGQYEINLDGVIVKKTGYSEAPHCGVVWTSDTLDGRKTHNLVVTYVARDERSPWSNNYLQLFKILYDDGPGIPSSSSTSSTPGNHQTNPPSNTPSGSSAPVGAIVGGVVGGVAAIALIGVAFLLFRRRRRVSQRNSGSYPGFVESTNALTTPTPFDPSQFPRQEPTPTQQARREKESLAAPPFPAGSSSSGPSNSHSASQSGELSQPDVERIAQRLATLVQPPRYEA
ncbi:hypothetical protein AURDEDRAFT_110792 [Auricularia subglabra TFB-10046 SS5]|nr:hypothetical protein AURDEDRAFT_110792 [Auricularia subglabra TFB-10046 SS5]